VAGLVEGVPRAELPAAHSSEEEDEDGGAPRMGFLQHLDELRSCLRNASIALLVATGLTYSFRGYLLALFAQPLIIAWSQVQAETGLGRPEMVFTSPVEGFMVELKLALLGAVFVASPVIFRELWKFISPGLYERERRWGIAFVIVSVVLFVGGALFAYKFVLPASFKYFLGYAGESMSRINKVFGQVVDLKLTDPFQIRPMISMDEYFGLTSMLLLVFGLVFELPLVLAVLSVLGIVSAAALWKFNRYAILLFAIGGAFLTPGDLVVGQLAMTLSLTILYNLSILIALVVQRKRREEEAALEAEDA
jgi:sec-independent protein translocase protein TatC